MENKVSSKLAIDKAGDLISNLDGSVFNDLTSELQAKRRIAVDNILASLDPSNQPIDHDVLQYIPLVLRLKKSSVHAIVFLEQCLRNRALFDPKVLSNSIIAATSEIKMHEHEGDHETLQLIQSTLVVLRKILLHHPHYKDNPQTYIHFGIELENNNRLKEAIPQYQKAIDLGNIDGYLYLSSVYEKLGDYATSARLSEDAFNLTKDPIFLHGYIRGLCRSGKSQEAFLMYKNYSKIFSKVDFLPFVFYLGSIETDEQLYEFEEYMIFYHKESPLEIETDIIKLSKEASVYVNQEIQKENLILAGINDKAGLLTERDITICQASIKRRLFLMQFDIIVLQNGYYLERYIDELTKYSIHGTYDLRSMLDEYFASYFSRSVFDKCKEDGYVPRGADYREFGGLESVDIHMDHIAELFSQFPYYEIMRDKIIPLKIQLAEMQSVEIDQETLDQINERLEILKYQKEGFGNLPHDVRKSYTLFVNGLFSQYGSFFIRNIQNAILYESDNPESTFIQSILSLKKPEISLLYLVDCIIGFHLSVEDTHALELFVAEHEFDKLDDNSISLLISIASFYGFHELVIGLIINHPSKILNKPNILYLVMEYICQMSDQDDPDDLINTINQLLQQRYGSQNIFEHIQVVTTGVIQSPEPTDEDIAYSLMASAYSKNKQGINKDDVIAEFKTAGEYGMYYGYMQAGEILYKDGDFAGAISLFISAYRAYPSKKIILRCIDIFLQIGNFNEAYELIQQAKMNGYQISGYISAYYLYQGDNKQAFEELIKVHRDGLERIEFPDWYMKLFDDTLDKIISGPSDSVDDAILILYASYLEISFFAPKDKDNPLEGYIKHIGLIKGVITRFQYHESSQILNTVLSNIVGDIESEDDFDYMMLGLHVHFNSVFTKLNNYHLALQNGNNPEKLSVSINYINTLALTAVEIFSLFPDSEGYMDFWRNKILIYPEKFDPNQIIFDMPSTIQ